MRSVHPSAWTAFSGSTANSALELTDSPGPDCRSARAPLPALARANSASVRTVVIQDHSAIGHSTRVLQAPASFWHLYNLSIIQRSRVRCSEALKNYSMRELRSILTLLSGTETFPLPACDRSFCKQTSFHLSSPLARSGNYPESNLEPLEFSPTLMRRALRPAGQFSPSGAP